MLVRNIKILLILGVVLWGIVGAHGNIAKWEETLGAVGAATSMATFEGGADSWKATSLPIVIWLGALFVMLSKVASAGLCAVGAQKMFAARNSAPDAFQKAKTFALAGCGVAVFMLFTGFIVIAESWFELWRSDVMRGPVLDSAYRYAGMIGLIAIFVSIKED